MRNSQAIYVVLLRDSEFSYFSRLKLISFLKNSLSNKGHWNFGFFKFQDTNWGRSVQSLKSKRRKITKIWNIDNTYYLMEEIVGRSDRFFILLLHYVFVYHAYYWRWLKVAENLDMPKFLVCILYVSSTIEMLVFVNVYMYLKVCILNS